MLLSDYFKSGVVRDGEFLKTMPPGARSPLSACYVANPQILKITNSNPGISAVITTLELASLVREDCGLVISDHPQRAYYQLHNHLVEQAGMVVHHEHAVHPSAHIASSAIIGKHVVIGEDVIIDHRAVIGDFTIIGAGSYIGHNVVTGVKGLQDTRIDGVAFPLKFAGGVKIGARCEILTNAIVERPYQAFYTEVGDDCKISIKASIGHGNRIGRGTMIAGSAVLAGDVTVGEDVFIGPSVTIAPAKTIGDRAVLRIGSVVVENVPPDKSVSGNFALDHTRHLRFYGRLRNGSI